jgi:hypothetical protein
MNTRQLWHLCNAAQSQMNSCFNLRNMPYTADAPTGTGLSEPHLIQRTLRFWAQKASLLRFIAGQLEDSTQAPSTGLQV